MSFVKAIKYGKEHRKEYHDSRAVDSTCRNHGTCPWCLGNRQHNSKKRESKLIEQLKDLNTDLL